MKTRGIKPHTRVERQAVVQQLIPLWQRKYGDRFLAAAVSASVARGKDGSYSDLELDVFLSEMPQAEEERYLQRVVDGMLIEVIYHTPEEYLRERMNIAPHWYISASDRLLPVYNPALIENLMGQIQAAQHTDQEFTRAATRGRFELQESFSKVLNAVEQNNVEGVSLLVMDAALNLLQTLALLNQRPFTTFGRFIHEARAFALKPERLDDFLDILVEGSYQHLPRLGEVAQAVFTSLEGIFRQRGIELFQDELDPNLPNQRYLDVYSSASHVQPQET
jgi:kanamycin nucleotidyltransferase